MILKDQNKSKRRIFSFHDHEAQMRSSGIKAKLNELERSRVCQASSSSSSSNSTKSSKPNLLLLDRYTFYKLDRIFHIEDNVPDKLEKWMVNSILTPSNNGFKGVGIYGADDSGKTALVKNVLKHKTVGDKLKCIVIWACLSELKCKEEIDDWIVKYLLSRLGLDTDSLLGNIDENKDGLMEEVERRLVNLRSYILVFDGMWHCSKWFTDDLLGKLLKKDEGGVVIVTSRRKTVAEQIGEDNVLIHLNPQFYKECAFLRPKI